MPRRTPLLLGLLLTASLLVGGCGGEPPETVGSLAMRTAVPPAVSS